MKWHLLFEPIISLVWNFLLASMLFLVQFYNSWSCRFWFCRWLSRMAGYYSLLIVQVTTVDTYRKRRKGEPICWQICVASSSLTIYDTDWNFYLNYFPLDTLFKTKLHKRRAPKILDSFILYTDNNWHYLSAVLLNLSQQRNIQLHRTSNVGDLFISGNCQRRNKGYSAAYKIQFCKI